MACNPQPKWMYQGALNLGGNLHDIPKQPKRILPSFDLDNSVTCEDHIKKFYIAFFLMNV